MPGRERKSNLNSLSLSLVIAWMSLAWSVGALARDEDCGCEEIADLKMQLEIQRKNQAVYQQAADDPGTQSSAGANAGERPPTPREEAAAQGSASASPDDPPVADGCTEQAPDERVGWVDHSSGACVPCVRKRWKEEKCKQMWDATRQHEMKHCAIETSQLYMVYLLARYGVAGAQAAGEVLAHQVEIDALEKALADLKKQKKCGWRGTITIEDKRNVGGTLDVQRHEGEHYGLLRCTTTIGTETTYKYFASLEYGKDQARVTEHTHKTDTQSKRGSVNCKKFAFEPDNFKSAGHEYRKVLDAQISDTAEASAVLSVSPDGTFKLRVTVGEAAGKAVTTETGKYEGYCEPIAPDSYPPGLPVDTHSEEKGPFNVTGMIDPKQRKIFKEQEFGTAKVTVDLEEF